MFKIGDRVVLLTNDKSQRETDSWSKLAGMMPGDIYTVTNVEGADWIRLQGYKFGHPPEKFKLYEGNKMKKLEKFFVDTEKIPGLQELFVKKAQEAGLKLTTGLADAYKSHNYPCRYQGYYSDDEWGHFNSVNYYPVWSIHKALKYLEDFKKEEELKIGEYKVEFGNEFIGVGCKYFGKKDVRALYDLMDRCEIAEIQIEGVYVSFNQIKMIFDRL